MRRQRVTAIAWVLIVFVTLIPSVNARSLPPIENPAKYEHQIIWVGELGDNLAVLTSGQGTLLLLVSDDGTLQKAIGYEDFIAKDAVSLGSNLYVLTVDGEVVEINETGGILKAAKPETINLAVKGIRMAKSGKFIYVLWSGNGLYLSQLLPDLSVEWTVELETENSVLTVNQLGSNFDVIPTPFGTYVLESIPGVFTRIIFVAPNGKLNWSAQIEGMTGIYGAGNGDLIYLIGTVPTSDGCTLGIVDLRPGRLGPIIAGTSSRELQTEFSIEYSVKTKNEKSAILTPESITFSNENLAVLLRSEKGDTYVMEFSKRGKFLRGIYLGERNPGKLGGYKGNIAIASTSRDGINIYMLSKDMKLKWAKTFLKGFTIERIVLNDGYWVHIKTSSWPWGYILHYSSNGTLENAFGIPSEHVVEGMAPYGGGVYVMLSHNGSESLEDLMGERSYKPPRKREAVDPYPTGGSFLSGTRNGLLVKFHTSYWPYSMESPGEFKELVTPLKALFRGPITGGIREYNQTILWSNGYLIVIEDKKFETARRYSISGGRILKAFQFNGTVSTIVKSDGMLCLITLENGGSYTAKTLGFSEGENVSISKAPGLLVILTKEYDQFLGINQTKIILIGKNGSMKEATVYRPLLGILKATNSTVLAYDRNGIIEVEIQNKPPALSECNWVEVSKDAIGVKIENGKLQESKMTLTRISPEKFYEEAYYQELDHTTTKAIMVKERTFTPHYKILPANGTKVIVKFTRVSPENGIVLYRTKAHRKSTHGICGPATFLLFAVVPLLRRIHRSQETF